MPASRRQFDRLPLPVAMPFVLAATSVGLLLLTVVIGCRNPDNLSQSVAMNNRADRGEALLSAVTSQLRDLPSYVETDLRPPSVVLDSTKTSDGKDVMAVCTVPPGVEDPLVNYLFVPAGNGSFRAAGLKPGDVLKYYALYDELSLEVGIPEKISMDLTVAQVISDNELLIVGGLNQPVLTPEKVEVWRYGDEQLRDIGLQLGLYVNRRLPPLGWEPTPDQRALQQIDERLNQWIRQSHPTAEWQIDPLLETLDPSLVESEVLAPHISPDALAGEFYRDHEGQLLQEAVWLRDISSWARGDTFNDLQRAIALFDWTVRNVQLDANSDAAPHRPWHTLVHGHGTAAQRAWVFALLARQQNLDVVILSLPPAGDEESAEGPQATEFWLPALVVDEQFNLFDTRLGLPIPGPGGTGVATLEQLRSNPSLLHALDLADEAYPVTQEQLEHVVANIVADEFSLSRRAKVFQQQLTGDDRLALAVEPSNLATNLAAIDTVAEVRIWDLPFRTLLTQLELGRAVRRREATDFEPFAWRPFLWKARTRHFQGRNRVDVDTRHGGLEEQINDHREATQLYSSRSVRPTNRQIERLVVEKQGIYKRSKTNATYWVGLMLYDDGKFATAEHWLGNPSLQTELDGQWASGARYNLARTFEAQGKLDEAITLLESDVSPQRHGNRLRAVQLRQALAAAESDE